MPRTVSLVHFDTCLPDFLANHMNGDREALIACAASNETTARDLVADLKSQFAGEEFYGKLDLPTQAEFDAAVAVCFSDVSDLDKVVDDTLEEAEDDSGSDVYFYFRLSWEAIEDDDVGDEDAIADVVAAYNISDADWEATPACVRFALILAHNA